MALTPAQKRRPHAPVSAQTSASYLERSFRENRTDEIDWWVSTGVVQKALDHPTRHEGLGWAIINGTHAGLDHQWLGKLNSTLAHALHNWAIIWLKRSSSAPPDMRGIDCAIAQFGVNPLHTDEHSDTSILIQLLRRMHTPATAPPDSVQRVDAWMTQFAATTSPRDTDKTVLALALLANTPNSMCTPQMCARWRDQLLSHPHTTTNIAFRQLSKAPDEHTSWLQALLSTTTTVPLDAIARLATTPSGWAMVSALWHKGASDPWLIEGSALGRPQSTLVARLLPKRVDHVPQTLMDMLETLSGLSKTAPDAWREALGNDLKKSLATVGHAPNASRAAYINDLARVLHALAQVCPPSPKTTTYPAAVLLCHLSDGSHSMLSSLLEAVSARDPAAPAAVLGLSHQPAKTHPHLRWGNLPRLLTPLLLPQAKLTLPPWLIRVAHTPSWRTQLWDIVCSEPVVCSPPHPAVLAQVAQHTRSPPGPAQWAHLATTDRHNHLRAWGQQFGAPPDSVQTWASVDAMLTHKQSESQVLAMVDELLRAGLPPDGLGVLSARMTTPDGIGMLLARGASPLDFNRRESHREWIQEHVGMLMEHAVLTNIVTTPENHRAQLKM